MCSFVSGTLDKDTDVTHSKPTMQKLRDKFKVVWLDEDYEDVHASIASWLLRRGEGR